MRILFDFDTRLTQLADITMVRKIFDAWEEILAKELAKADLKEEKAALETVKTIIREPVAKKEEPEVVTKPEEKRVNHFFYVIHQPLTRRRSTLTVA